MERVHFKKAKKKLNFDSEESLPSVIASPDNKNQSQFTTKPAEAPLRTTSQPPKRQRKQTITRRDDF